MIGTRSSDFSAYDDVWTPDRKAVTEKFWRGMATYECSTAELAVRELEQTKDAQLRGKLLALLAGFRIHPITSEMHALADQSVRAGAFVYPVTLPVAPPDRTRQLVAEKIRHERVEREVLSRQWT